MSWRTADPLRNVWRNHYDKFSDILCKIMDIGNEMREDPVSYYESSGIRQSLSNEGGVNWQAIYFTNYREFYLMSLIYPFPK